METRGRYALCVPEEKVASIVGKGLTFGEGRRMEAMLDDLMEYAEERHRDETPLDAGVVWITPYIVLGNLAERTCFASRRREEGADCFSPLSLGVTGCCMPDENVEMAIARILYESVGIRPNEVLDAGVMGFLWTEDSSADAHHIAVVYRILVNDPDDRVIESDHFKGMWLDGVEMRRMNAKKAFDDWSGHIFRQMAANAMMAG